MAQTAAEVDYHVAGVRTEPVGSVPETPESTSEQLPTRRASNKGKGRARPTQQPPRATSSYSSTRQGSSRRGPVVRYAESSADDLDFDDDGEEEEEDVASDESEWGAASRRRTTARTRTNASRAERAARRQSGRPSRYRDDGSEVDDEEDGDDSDDSRDSDRSTHRRRRSHKAKKCQLPYTDFLPSDWISMVEPAPTPYVPQMHDEVVYFRQGHAEYITETNQACDSRGHPFNKYENLDAAEFCRVEGIRYEIGPPSDCVLRLKLTDNADYPDTTFSLKYRDQDNILDFVVLRHRFDEAESIGWKQGDRFRSFVSGTWYHGTILKKESHDVRFPGSPWRSLRTRWDPYELNGESHADVEIQSPWELEPLGGGSAPATPSAAGPTERQPNGASPTLGSRRMSREEKAMQVQIERIARADILPSQMRTSGEGDATSASASAPAVPQPPFRHRESISDAETARILGAVSKVARLEISCPFRYPVPFDEYKEYCRTIAYPIDLQTIRRRIKSRFYRREAALLWDIDQIKDNCGLFNEDASEICRNASVIVESLRAVVDRPDVHDVIAEFPALTVEDGDVLYPDSDPEHVDNVREEVVAKNNQTVREIAPDAETAELWVKVNRKRLPDLTASAKLKQGTVIYGPTQDELDNGILSADEDEPSASRYRYIATDDETLTQIAKALDVHIKRLVALNRDRLGNQVHGRSKLIEGTSIMVPLRAVVPEARRGAPEDWDKNVELDEGDDDDDDNRAGPSAGPIVLLGGTPQKRRKQPSARDARALGKGRKSAKTGTLPTMRIRVAGTVGVVVAGESWLKSVELFHFGLMAKPIAHEYLNEPVDTDAFPDYTDKVEFLQDFGTIQQDLALHKLKDEDDYCTEVRLVLANAMKYNHRNSDLWAQFAELQSYFEDHHTHFSRVTRPAKGEHIFATTIADRKDLQKDLLALHRKLMKHVDAPIFNDPVDPDEVPGYNDIVSQAMDLGTVNRQLASQEYETVASYVADVTLVFANAREFNEFGSDISIQASTLYAYFCGQLENLVAFTAFDVLPMAQAGDVPGCHTRIDAFLQETLTKVIDDFSARDDAEEFRTPVSPSTVDPKKYLAAAPKPMDLSTVGKRLEAGFYNTVGQLASDVDTIWANARSFNSVRSPYFEATMPLARDFADALTDAVNTHVAQEHDPVLGSVASLYAVGNELKIWFANDDGSRDQWDAEVISATDLSITVKYAHDSSTQTIPAFQIIHDVVGADNAAAAGGATIAAATAPARLVSPASSASRSRSWAPASAAPMPAAVPAPAPVPGLYPMVAFPVPGPLSMVPHVSRRALAPAPTLNLEGFGGANAEAFDGEGDDDETDDDETDDDDNDSDEDYDASSTSKRTRGPTSSGKRSKRKFA